MENELERRRRDSLGDENGKWNKRTTEDKSGMGNEKESREKVLRRKLLEDERNRW